MTPFDFLVIGGGFYGLYLAAQLARHGRTLLLEAGPVLMGRASLRNQARVHGGYHYPRSMLTAGRSRANFPRFVAEFRPAVVDQFRKLYAIPRHFSKVTPDQFAEAMRRVGAPIRPAPPDLAKLFDPTYIAGSFLVEECAFDAVILRDLMVERACRAGVVIRLNCPVTAVHAGEGNRVRVTTADGDIDAGQAFGCTYSQLNLPATGGGLPLVPLKHELTEMALVELPAVLAGLAVTVMDGPFFSVMPFPSRGLHTLSHVRTTPHAHWFDRPGEPYRPAYATLAQAERRSAFPHMVRDAARFLPALADCVYRDSLWEVKTVLPRSEVDDSRPILFKPHWGVRNYHLVMGGKIDNVYDIAEVVERLLAG